MRVFELEKNLREAHEALCEEVIDLAYNLRAFLKTTSAPHVLEMAIKRAMQASDHIIGEMIVNAIEGDLEKSSGIKFTVLTNGKEFSYSYTFENGDNSATMEDFLGSHSERDGISEAEVKAAQTALSMIKENPFYRNMNGEKEELTRDELALLEFIIVDLLKQGGFER